MKNATIVFGHSNSAEILQQAEGLTLVLQKAAWFQKKSTRMIELWFASFTFEYYIM